MKEKLKYYLGIILLICVALIGMISSHTADPASAVSSVQMIGYNAGLEEQHPGDAYRTTYEIFVYSFCDSDGDGIGDLEGIRSKLDYIQDLGFDQLWLTPVHPSGTYHKYDVNDYYAIDPSFGTTEDYERLLADCHERGIRVLMDMVINHTSSAHPWFQTAASYVRSLAAGAEPSAAECREFGYYNFNRGPKDGYAQLYGTDWYYEARFWSEMPDLNLSNEQVRAEIRDIAAFWLNKGVDGFRLDAVTSYYTADNDASRDFMRFFCDTCRSVKPSCYVVGEAWTDRGSIAGLYRSGIDSLFNFPFADGGGIIRSLISGSMRAGDYVYAMIASDNAFRSQNENYIDAPFYTNHDMGRNAGFYALDNGPQTKMAYALSLLMSGCSYVYYGEEIGMKGAGKDENKRAPMYWSSAPDAPGMCRPSPGMDAVQMKFPPLDEQVKDDLSVWRWFREVIRVRNAFPVIARGNTAAVESLCTDSLAGFVRYDDVNEPVLIVINMRDSEQTADIGVMNEPLKLSAVLNTSEEHISFENNMLKLPAMSIAVLTEKRD